MDQRSQTTDSLCEFLLSRQDGVLQIQKALCALPATGPENGGDGEFAKAVWIENFLKNLGMECQRLDSPDNRVKSGIRPNLIACIPGRRQVKLWLFGHMDVVPPGNLRAWRSDPWEVKKDGDFIIGRGVEDNQQAIASMLILAEAIVKMNIQSDYGLGLVFMADEECGSSHGLKWILRERHDLFSHEDMFIVPDGGSPDAREIEIAEKAQLWLKFTVSGHQSHASMPQLGNNSLVAASALILELGRLCDIFAMKDSLFTPDHSTFVVTRHEENVPAINILPGEDVFYMDCRLLPGIDPSQVMEAARKICDQVEQQYKVRIGIQVVHEQPVSAVSLHTPIIKRLSSAIERVYGVKPVPVGIGGATVAAMLREKGFPAVVWSCILNTCHQPNEMSSLSNTCKDAAVFSLLLTGRDA